jgi:hypothetical protein
VQLTVVRCKPLLKRAPHSNLAYPVCPSVVQERKNMTLKTLVETVTKKVRT